MINLLVLCLQISSLYALPVQIMPYARLVQQQVLQQQLTELQAMLQTQTMSGLNTIQQAVMIILPNEQNTNELEENDTKIKEIDQNAENDSEVVDAADDVTTADTEPIFIPAARLSIGEIISYIPFLPIEINVPDTISWAYNGISNGIAGIISIIGQRLPFRTQDSNMSNRINLKNVLNHLRVKNQNMVSPIIIMPLNGLRLPIQV